MKHVMVRYRVKPDTAAENENYVRAVFAALERERPPDLRYSSFKLPDGVSFVHIASMPDGANPLLALDAFRRFTENIRDRCDEPPASIELAAIGTYAR